MPDIARHKEYMNLPLDWPRINQFPEYFTVESGKTYTITTDNNRKEIVIGGDELRNGFPVRLRPGESVRIIIEQSLPE